MSRESAVATMPMRSRDSEDRPPMRLLFDRRYGWVIDEWKDPSKEALSGGRGMFCIVPLAKATLQVASNMIDSASSSIIEVIKNPQQLSPEFLKTALNDQLQKVLKSTQKSNFHLLPLQGNSSILCSGIENLNVETYESPTR